MKHISNESKVAVRVCIEFCEEDYVCIDTLLTEMWPENGLNQEEQDWLSELFEIIVEARGEVS